MSSRKHISKEEEQYIIENWSSSSAKNIAEHLGRSSSGVRKKARQLGCDMRECKRWTKEEDDLLFSSQGKCLSSLSKQLGRHDSECSARAKVLGISSWRYHRNGGKFKNRRGYVVSGFKPRGRSKGTRIVFEHHVVMAEYLGRDIEPGEVVHHINGVKDDNRKENLYLCQDASHHRKVHCSLDLLLPQLIEIGAIEFDEIEGVYRLCKPK